MSSIKLSLNKESTIFMKVKVSNNYTKDKNHLRYISTRPGAVQENIQDEKHLGYMDERPRSTGLFGPDKNNYPLLKEAMEEVGDRGDPTSWRLVISLKESDALALGYDTPEKWRDLTRRYMAEYARILGYDDKEIKWVAAHHREPGHPHVHVLAWVDDKAPKRKPFLNSNELRDCKRKLAQEVFGPIRTQLMKEKTLARNSMVDVTKENVAYVERLIKKCELEIELNNPGEEVIIPSFTKQEIDELKNKLIELSKAMPGKGRAVYAFMPKEVKDQVDNITEWILQRENIKPLLDKYEESTLELTKMYTKNPDKLDEAWDSAHKDIENRIGNVIVRATAELNKKGMDKEFKVDQQTRHIFRTVSRILNQERRKAEAQAELASMREEEKAKRRGKQSNAAIDRI